MNMFMGATTPDHENFMKTTSGSALGTPTGALGLPLGAQSSARNRAHANLAIWLSSVCQHHAHCPKPRVSCLGLRTASDITECPKARVNTECPRYGRCLRQLGQRWPIYLGLRTVNDATDRPKP